MEAHQLAERECETGLMSGQQNVTVLVILCFFYKHWPVEQSPSWNHTSLLFASQPSLESMTIGFYRRQPCNHDMACAARKTGISKENDGGNLRSRDELLFAKPCRRILPVTWLYPSRKVFFCWPVLVKPVHTSIWNTRCAALSCLARSLFPSLNLCLLTSVFADLNCSLPAIVHSPCSFWSSWWF